MKKQIPTEKDLNKKADEFLSNLKELIDGFSKEILRQSPEEHADIIRSTEFDANPVALRHNAFIWRGNAESFSVFYERTVLKYDIFLVESEEQLRTMFGKMIPDVRIRIQERRISDVIYLFKALSAHNVKIIAVTNHLQQIMPYVFETKIGPVDYGTVKTRTSLDPCVASEKRRKILDGIVEDIIWENRNS